MKVLRDHDYESTSWQARSKEWNYLSQLLFNGEGEYLLSKPATVKPYADFIRHLFVRTTPSTLASIKITSDESMLIAEASILHGLQRSVKRQPDGESGAVGLVECWRGFGGLGLALDAGGGQESVQGRALWRRQIL